MKDLGIKIGTTEEVFWTDLKKKSEQSIIDCKHEIVVAENLIKLAKEKLLLEKRKN